MKRLTSLFTDLRKEIQKKHQNPVSMFLRLFTFLCLFLFSIILGVFLILVLTGVFNSGVHEYTMLLDNELTHLSEDVSNTYGKYSVLGISLSKNLTDNIENELQKHSFTIKELKQHAELIEPILDSQMDLLISQLKYANTSGIFLVLDTGVNASIKDSNSGIFLKSTNANLSSAVDSSIRYLRGPADIARSHKVELLPQWRMEFDTSNADFYLTTMETARNNSNLSLAQLYYWSQRVVMEDSSDPGMLLCVPLISQDGSVFGICGFEVSSMYFKSKFSPDNQVFPRIFSVLAPRNNDTFQMQQGLLAGNYYQINYYSGTSANITKSSSYNNYNTLDFSNYSGMDCNITLYPGNSIHADNTWSLAVMMPEKDLENAVHTKNMTLLLLLSLLLFASLVLAFYISRRYIQPMIRAMHSIKTQGASSVMKTNISEIDDLVEFLVKQDEEAAKKESYTEPVSPTTSDLADLSEKNVNLTAYNEFIRNIETLSKAERAVFNLYMEGYTAKEIAAILYLSINTIKTHNKRIYMKLNVSSRKELMVYVQMMKKEELS